MRSYLFNCSRSRSNSHPYLYSNLLLYDFQTRSDMAVRHLLQPARRLKSPQGIPAASKPPAACCKRALEDPKEGRKGRQRGRRAGKRTRDTFVRTSNEFVRSYKLSGSSQSELIAVFIRSLSEKCQVSETRSSAKEAGSALDLAGCFYPREGLSFPHSLNGIGGLHVTNFIGEQSPFKRSATRTTCDFGKRANIRARYLFSRWKHM